MKKQKTLFSYFEKKDSTAAETDEACDPESLPHKTAGQSSLTEECQPGPSVLPQSTPVWDIGRFANSEKVRIYVLFLFIYLFIIFNHVIENEHTLWVHKVKCRYMYH